MIHFKVSTHRTFKTKDAFAEFMLYLKDHVPPEVYESLMKTGVAHREDENERGDTATAKSKWVVFDDGLTPWEDNSGTKPVQ